MFRCQTKQQRMFQGVTSEKSNRYWDIEMVVCVKKYIFIHRNGGYHEKKNLCRALIGAPIGLAISTAITIFSSLIYGDGNYYPVVPALVEQCGNEINAVVAADDRIFAVRWQSGQGASVIWGDG